MWNRAIRSPASKKNPWGTVLHQCGAGEQVAVTELNMSRVSAIREQLPILSARRTDVYGVRKK